MIEILPTVVPASQDDIAGVVSRFGSFAHTIHIDVTDGIFAPNITWMPREGDALAAQKDLVYEAHLMVSDPRATGVAFARAGATRLIGHVEAMENNIEEIFSAWKAAGATEVGLGVLYHTPLGALDPHISRCDVVQMMSIASIGVQGIPYEPGAPARIATLHARYPKLLIADDGGVSESNIAELARAGVSRFCVGSALSRAADPASTYRRLSELAGSAIQSTP